MAADPLVSVGNHTADHAILIRHRDDDVRAQIRWCQDYLATVTGLVPEALATIAHAGALAKLPAVPMAVPAVPLPVPPEDAPPLGNALVPAVLVVAPLDVPAVPLSSGSSFTQPTNRPLETSTAANAE